MEREAIAVHATQAAGAEVLPCSYLLLPAEAHPAADTLRHQSLSAQAESSQV